MSTHNRILLLTLKAIGGACFWAAFLCSFTDGSKGVFRLSSSQLQPREAKDAGHERGLPSLALTFLCRLPTAHLFVPPPDPFPSCSAASRDGQTLATIRTTHVIPADLNAFLLQMERNIAFFANATANSTLADQFTAYAAGRQAAIDAVLWSPSLGRWTDFVLNTNTLDGSSCSAVYTGAQRNGSVYASDYVPLWAGALPAGDC
jgi:hypothetical protein